MLVPRAKWERKKFCSRTCLGVVNADRMNSTRRPPKEYATPPVMYGKENPMWRAPARLQCAQCGTEFDRPHWRVRNRKSPPFCNFACKTAYWRAHRSGENAPDWVGGPKTYRGRGWLRARAAVVADQNGRCADCDVHVGRGMHVHHIIPFRLFPSAEVANQRRNLVGLCGPCHMLRENHGHRSPRRKAARPAQRAAEPSPHTKD